jgi:CRISPR/Cas system-associated exonuclease Cas4 (RecB family)
MSQISKSVSAPFRISPLRIRVFDTCLLRYRYQYVERVPARLRPQDTAGSLLHRVLCEFFSKVPPEERHKAQLVRMFEEGWEALSPRYRRMRDVSRLRNDSLEQLRMFAERNDLSACPLMVEPYFQVDVAPGIVLFGRVDRIDEEAGGMLHLIDYKTGSHPDEVDAKQLRLYAIMAEESLGKPVRRTSFWRLDDGDAWTENFGDPQRRLAHSELLQAVEQMHSISEFPSSVGPHCGHCPYLYACSERQEIQRRRLAEGW